MELVVFLRGVNVGSKRFQPTLLARELSHLDAVNLGAAGTFVIRGALVRSALRDEFLRRLPFSAHLMICQGRDIARLVATEPFPDATLPAGWRHLGRSFVEPNGIVEKHCGVRATTRNWNTMVRLCELLGSAKEAPPVKASHR